LKEEKKPNLLEELVSKGFLTREQMEKCNSELKTSQKSGEHASLTKILIDRSYLSAEQLIQFLELRQGS